jgi:serine/threonine protein kinase
MTNASCPTCGKPLPSGRAECPACLFAQGFATGSDGADSLPDLGEIQSRFPHFEILECLGRGGMGVVYKARQKSLNRLVALKVLAPEREHDTHFFARFSREAEILARLNHPRIVTIHDFGESGAWFYLVMEFVDGVSLRDVLREGRMEPRQALAIVPEICDALQFAHDHGVVHRDIKPENILLDRQGRVKVADFGIAKLADMGNEPAPETGPGTPQLTQAGKVLGTPAYMAPEQMTEPDKVDHRADIYALGAVFYQMLTGETPQAAAEPPSRKVTVDVRLDEIVLRALEKDPARRYQRVSEVRTRLENLEEREAPDSKPRVILEKKKLSRWLLGPALIPFSVAASLVVLVIVIRTLQPREQADLNQAWKLWNEQRYSEAKVAFEKALKTDPNNANGWNGLGWSLFNSGRTAEAVPAFEKAVSLDPGMPGSLNGLGQIALFQGDFRKAEDYLLRAAPMAPAAWFGLTRIYLLEGKFGEAIPWAQKIVDSGQGGGLATLMLEAAKSGHLNETLRQKISPPTPPRPANSSSHAEVPLSSERGRSNGRRRQILKPSPLRDLRGENRASTFRKRRKIKD